MSNPDKKYVYELRKCFSKKECIKSNGELNHKYFQTKINQYWSEDDNEKLMKGIEEFGVGAWTEIKNKYLKNWTETDLKLRSGYIFKLVNFEKYNSYQLTKEEILKLAIQNEKEGKEKNKFKYGVYFN